MKKENISVRDSSNIYSIIDVGTNNILLLIAKSGAKNEIISRFSATSALGKDMENNLLTVEAIRRTRNILEDFINKSKQYTNQIIVIGTSCSREADNIDQISDWLKEKYQINYQIISGEEEAELNGLANICEFDAKNLLLFDVGGGSTEFTFISEQKIEHKLTTEIGIRRYLNIFGSDLDLIRKEVNKEMSPILKYVNKEFSLVGIGGTTCSLAAMKHKLRTYNSEIVHKSYISRSELRSIITQIGNLDLKQLQEVLPFDSKRAEIILVGTTIVKEIVDSFQSAGFFVSDRGLQFGVLRLEVETLANLLKRKEICLK